MQTAYPSGIGVGTGTLTPLRVAGSGSSLGSKWVLRLIFVGALLGATGCISAPPKKPNPIEQARRENAIGSDLARQFEAQLRYHEDAKVNHYLNRIATALATSGPEKGHDPRLTETRIAVIADTGKFWRSYSLPGRKVYLPIGLLQRLRYDNEFAAAIAFEDGNILTTHAIDNLNRQIEERAAEQNQKSSGFFLARVFGQSSSEPVASQIEPASGKFPKFVDFLGKGGIFTYSTEQLHDSIRSAIQLMYAAGFDIRGMIEVWSRYEENPEHSPYSQDTIEDLLEFTRQTISLYAPMRNPIVDSRGLEAIRKRIDKL